MKLALAFVALLIPLLFCQSQQPPPTPTGQNKNSKTDSKQDVDSNNQSSTNSISTAIDKLTSEVAAWKQQQASRQNKEDTSASWWLKGSTIATALATLAIALLGYFQWKAMDKQRVAMEQQTQHMEAALAETTKAANAATSAAATAELALKTAERADVLVNDVYISGGIHPTAIDGRKLLLLQSQVTIVIKNCGRTLAHEITAKYRCTITPDLPEMAFNTHGPSVLGAGETGEMPFVPNGVWFTPEIIDKITRGESMLSWEAEISYLTFGCIHSTKAHGAFMPRDGKFATTSSKAN